MKWAASIVGAAALLWTQLAHAQAGNCTTIGGTFAKWGAGGAPVVKINFDSFEGQGIPSSQKPLFENSVKETIERWKQVSAANVRPVYGGFTTSSTAGSNEILIVMEDDDFGSQNKLARADLNNRKIFFFRRDNSGQNFPWVFFWPANPDPAFGLDIQATLMHEFGHMLGLLDHSDVLRATMGLAVFDDPCAGAYDWSNQRFGPNFNDAARLVSVYGTFNSLRVRTRLSTNDGVSWSSLTNSLTTDSTVATTIEPAGLRDATTVESFVIAFRNNSKRVEFVVSDNHNFSNIVRHQTFPALPQSWYGPAIAGESSEWMIAFIDPSQDAMRVRVRYSTDAGANWVARDPSFTDLDGSSRRAMGSPGLARSATNGNVWYLAYPVLDLTQPTRTGWTVILRSSDDGVTWSQESANSDPNYFSTQWGVSLAHHASDAFVAGAFSWENFPPQNFAYGYRWNKDNLTVEVSPDTSDAFSMFRPSIGRSSAAFLFMALTQKDTGTIRSARRAPGNTDWQATVSAGVTTPIGPAFAADDDRSNIYIYYFN